jgi:regulator of extracellular matrix RemA (YlzA/DUF370 family)
MKLINIGFGNLVSAERLVALGRCFARAMKKYIKRNDLP